MIGSILLTLALVSSLTAMVMYYLGYRGYKNALNYGRIAYHVMALLVIISAAVLEYLIITHQYQYEYIYSYSSNNLPKGILMATFWAGQQGSFMLWLLLTSIVGLILQSYSSKRGDLEPRVMAVFALSTTFLLVMVSPMFKDPFAYIWAVPTFISAKDINANFIHMPFLQNFLFSDGSSGKEFVKMDPQLYALLSSAGITVKQFIADGKGLNPQLTNFWMQIHPPILFSGFSMATVPFAFAMAAMMKNDYKDWVKQSFPWVLAAAGILGLGIMLGGYWAYEMLGWGGYWAWDPVENSSLIPWLVSVAAVHTMLVQRKSQKKTNGFGRYVRTNLILSIMIYILVLYSTFLTRSGVLGDASVHSFVDPGMMVYLFLIIFVGVFFLLGFGTLIYRWGFLSKITIPEDGLLSRELALFTATVALCASALIVIVGTSAPIFGTSVTTAFYDEMNLPIVIIIGFLNGFSLLLKWKHTKGQDLVKKSLLPVAATIVASALLIILSGITDVMIMLLVLSAAFALFVNLDIAIKIIRGNLKMLGAYVAHIGIALFILGVIGSEVYSHEKDLDLVKGKPQDAFGYQLTFTGYTPIENNTKYAFNINLKKGNSEYTVKPIMYISDFNNSLMREPAILNMLTKDFYVSPLGYDNGSSDQTQGHNAALGLGDETSYEGAKITYKDFIAPNTSVMMNGGDFKMGAKLVVQKDGKTYNVDAMMKKEGRNIEFVPIEIKDANLKIVLEKLDPNTKKADFVVSHLTGENEAAAKPKEVLTITASTKPFISLVWMGVLVMVFGFFISVARRLKESLV